MNQNKEFEDPRAMSPAALRDAIGDLGMTQGALADLIGVEHSTVRKWLAGSRNIPLPPALLIQLLANNTLSAADITNAKRELRVRIPLYTLLALSCTPLALISCITLPQ